MPNFKLGSSLPTQMNKRCQDLTQRRVDYARAGWPLTRDMLQAATIDPGLLTDLLSIKARGVAELPQDQYPYVRLERAALPGLLREAVVRVHMFESIHVKQTTSFYGDSIAPNKNHSLLVLDPGALDPDAAVRLARWANELVRVSRHKQLVDGTVCQVLNHCPSIGHVLAAWPMLANLVEDPFWKARFRNGPRDLRNYAPSISLLREHGKRMQASEAVLAEAEMLEPYKRTAGETMAILEAWEKLPRDIE